MLKLDVGWVLTAAFLVLVSSNIIAIQEFISIPSSLPPMTNHLQDLNVQHVGIFIILMFLHKIGNAYSLVGA